MKRVFFLLIIALFVLPAVALAELKLTGVVFKTEQTPMKNMAEGILGLSLQNIGDKEIIALRGTFECKNAFGDVSFEQILNADSANILPGQTHDMEWGFNFMKPESTFLKSNRADNFDCYFVEGTLEIAHKK